MSSFTASTALPSPASTTLVAPSERASSSFSGTTSTATIREAPASRAPCTTASPTPPHPITATDEPSCTGVDFSPASLAESRRLAERAGPPVTYVESDVYSADYKAHGEACKAVLLRELGIDVLVDDHPGYLVWPWPGPAPLRLRVEPDVHRPYHAPEWETDGSEGDFGRHAYYGGGDRA